MSLGARVVRWNRWYDNAPELWRFQFVVWSLLFLGTINMLLTVVSGFPFALLLVLGILALVAIRLPYTRGWVSSPVNASAEPPFRIGGTSRIVDLNRRYEAMPDTRRFWVYPAVLLIAGGINMLLTIDFGFPFGLLFLLALLGLVVIRAPYTAGWLAEPAGVVEPAAFEPPVVEPVAVEPVAVAPPVVEPAHDPAPVSAVEPHAE